MMSNLIEQLKGPFNYAPRKKGEPHYLKVPEQLIEAVFSRIKKLEYDRDLYKATCMADDSLIKQLQNHIKELKQIIIDNELHDSACGITTSIKGWEIGEYDCYLSKWQQTQEKNDG